MAEEDEKKESAPKSPRKGQDAMSMAVEEVAEAAKPGVVQVANAAPKGKTRRTVVGQANSPARPSLTGMQALQEPDLHAPENVRASAATSVQSAATPSPARVSRRADAKSAIREEMNALRQKGEASKPGAVSVASSATSTMSEGKAALRAEVDALRNKNKAESTPSAADAGDSKAVIRQEMAALREKHAMDRPGAVSVASTDSTRASSRKGQRTSQNTRENRAELKSAAMASRASAGAGLKKPPPTLGSPLRAASNSEEEKMSEGLAKDLGLAGMMNANTRNSVESVKPPAELTKRPSENAKPIDSDPTLVENVEGLVAAQVIDEADLERQVQEKVMQNAVAAEAISEDELKAAENKRCFRIVCLFAILLAIVLGVSIPLATRDDDEPPTAAPTLASDEDYLVDILEGVSGDKIFNETTTQYKAFRWLLDEDTGIPDFRSVSDAKIIERYVCTLFYYSTGGETWLDQLNFLSNQSVCEWYEGAKGIRCSESEEDEEERPVFSISINSNNVTGTIPTEIGLLDKLERLQSTSGAITGTIPTEVGNLRFLQRLQFPVHQFSGTIPTEIALLSNLLTLNFFRNRLTGTIPEKAFETSTTLTFTVLANNQINGTIPSIRRNGAIDTFVVENNLMTGSIPVDIFQQPMKLLYLNNNRFSGSILEDVGVLTDMTNFQASNNLLTGTIPTEFGSAESLVDLRLDGNNMEGPIPTEISKLDKLEKLYLSSNKLTGNVPSEFGLLESLENLQLTNNLLVGEVPQELAGISSLGTLLLSQNDFTGGIEESFCAADILFASITADCGGAEPDISCSCCTSCCDGENCELNLFGVCETQAASFETDPSRGTQCSCPEGGQQLFCTDTTCQSCNRDGTICAENQNYGYAFNETSGETLYFETTLQYVVGRDETVQYRNYISTQQPCEVSVNGEQCNDCFLSNCPSGDQGLFIDCSNLENSNPVTTDTCANFEDDFEYLTVFFYLDPTLGSGCIPVIDEFLSE